MAISEMAATKRELEDDLIKTHIEYVKAKSQLGNLKSKDMRIISIVIPMCSQLITNANVNLVINYYKKMKIKVLL